jgi:hypothetical protein
MNSRRTPLQAPAHRASAITHKIIIIYPIA